MRTRGQLKDSKWTRKIAAGLAAFGFLFDIIAPPFLQSSIWEERRAAMENSQKTSKDLTSAFTTTILPPSLRGKSVKNNPDDLKNQLGIKVPEDLGTVVESWAPPKATVSDQ